MQAQLLLRSAYDQQTQIINQNESQLCTIELGQKNHQASRFDLNYVKLKKDL